VTVFLGADNSVKLGDFGLSKLMQSHDFASTYVGTPFYMSPEICAAERYTLHSDIWSLGCIMYELCARTPPFNAKTHFHLVQKIKDGRIDPLPSLYSQELQNVIKSCLKINPLHRPDTAQLLSLPMMRLMRKEGEVVELGKVLRATEQLVKIRIQEAEAKALSLEREKALVDSTVRREWEVKARLEIDRQIQIETDRLRKNFEAEVQSRVEKEVQARLEVINAGRGHPPSSPTDIQLSSIGTGGETDFPSSTDLTSLSMDSPPADHPTHATRRRPSRTPFTRSRTQFDSPMDIQMGESSPMSIASLSLSPRRTGASAVSGIPNSKNIFARAAAKNDKANQIQLPPSPPPSLGPLMEDDDDSLIQLSSPTRGPLRDQDPFKVPGRPALHRQKTAPARRLSSHPTLFQPISRPAGRIPSPNNASTASGSPVRKAPARPLATGENDMFKAVMQRNFLGNGGGRTLVELAQAKTGGMTSGLPAGRPEDKNPEEKRDRSDDAVPVWDPERDEMPSPFLVRGAKGLRRL
jgi:NIMA (never in mitosis gene a)-related kinase